MIILIIMSIMKRITINIEEHHSEFLKKQEKIEKFWNASAYFRELLDNEIKNKKKGK